MHLRGLLCRLLRRAARFEGIEAGLREGVAAGAEVFEDVEAVVVFEVIEQSVAAPLVSSPQERERSADFRRRVSEFAPPRRCVSSRESAHRGEECSASRSVAEPDEERVSSVGNTHFPV